MGQRIISENKLKTILEKHKLWCFSDPKGKRANLYKANLYESDLREADLYKANLYKANLREADLYKSDLREADLREADLRGANLRGANLRGADLREADLRGANLRGADLRGAYIDLPIACPEEGSFIGFKKVQGPYIVKLEITNDALRSSATSRKCRCSKAKVISITNLDGSEANVSEVFSKYDESFSYKTGSIVYVNNFDRNRWNECAPGIHFFMTREEAVKY